MSISAENKIKSGIFPTTVVITLYTGRLCCNIQDVCEALNYLTGEDVFTHQIPRVLREVQPFMLEMFPQLERTIKEAESIASEDTLLEWRSIWNMRYGAEMTLPKLPSERHEKINPIDELPKNKDSMLIIKQDPPAR